MSRGLGVCSVGFNRYTSLGEANRNLMVVPYRMGTRTKNDGTLLLMEGITMINIPEDELTPAAIEFYKSQGLNQSDIAKLLGVSRQAVSKCKFKNPNFSRSVVEQVSDYWPLVGTYREQWKAPGFRRLRDHGIYILSEDGKDLSEDSLARLINWYLKLQSENLILDFNPDHPTTEENKYGGFVYKERTEEDEDFVIRENPHTVFTAENENVWRLPVKMPSVYLP